MIMTWYHPSWCGDYRLETLVREQEGLYHAPQAAEDVTCTVLTVTDPTPAEIVELSRFLDAARRKGWVSKLAGLRETGMSQLEISASIWEAGHLLLHRRGKPRQGVITAVKSVAGTVEAIAGTEADAEAKVQEAIAAPSADTAVTTPRPTPCCPRPVSGPEQRASDVLQEFCTSRQWNDWLRYGQLVVVGNLSGHAYRIAHRHSPVARRQGRCAWDLTTDRVMHMHCSQLPPPEEVLAIKLAIEHREHWVRNSSTAFSGRGPYYPDPFMTEDRQGLDGVVDATITQVIGGAFRMLRG